MDKNKKLQKLNTSVISRVFRIAKVTASGSVKAGANLVSNLAKSKSEKEQSWQNFAKDQAITLANELSELKGSLLKAGQLLSMYGEYFLPEDVNIYLKKLQSEAKTIEYAFVEKHLKNELKEKFNLLEVDPEPIGSASLSQVHKAKIKSSGRWIALKLKYPDVEKTIDSDLKVLQFFMKRSHWLPAEVDLTELFAEIRLMLYQEIDFQAEIENFKQIKELLMGDDRYVVPEVIEEFCTPDLIAMSYEPGLRPDHSLIKNLPLARRNIIATNFVELYFKELFSFHLVQTDPHFGNYALKINPDHKDQIILYDFGATKKLTPEFVARYRKFIEYSLSGEKEKLRQICLEMNFLNVEDSQEFQNLFLSTCMTVTIPYQENNQPYDWSKSDLPSIVTKNAWELSKQIRNRKPPSEMLFIDRKTAGVFIFLNQFAGPLNLRPLLLKYLKKTI